MSRKVLHYPLYLGYLLFAFALAGCEVTQQDAVLTATTSTDYPYLISAPQLSATTNVNDQQHYDVTVSLQASGPAPLQLVTVTIESLDGSVSAPLTLQLQQYIAGSDANTWSGSTAQPLPAGNYRIQSIALFDGDTAQGGTIKSGIYDYNAGNSQILYTIFQMEADYTSDPNNPQVLSYTLPGNSDIAVIEFDPSQL